MSALTLQPDELRQLLADLDAERRYRQRVRHNSTGPQIAYTWRRVAIEAGVSPATLSLLRAGRRATDETVAQLRAWINGATGGPS